MSRHRRETSVGGPPRRGTGNASGQGGNPGDLSSNSSSSCGSGGSSGTTNAMIASTVDVHALVTKAAMFQKKIAETGSLRDTIRFLSYILHMIKGFGGDDVVFSSVWQQRNTVAWTSIKGTLVDWIELLKKQRDTQRSWSMVAFQYMLDGQAASHNLFTPDTMNEYATFLRKLLPFLSTAMAAIVTEFVAYLTSHTMDPYSCLIGLSPTSQFVASCATVTEAQLDSMIANTLAALTGASVDGVTTEQELQHYRQALRSVLRSVVGWAALPDPTDAHHSVQHFVALQRGISSLPNGSVVIVNLAEAIEDESKAAAAAAVPITTTTASTASTAAPPTPPTPPTPPEPLSTLAQLYAPFLTMPNTCFSSPERHTDAATATATARRTMALSARKTMYGVERIVVNRDEPSHDGASTPKSGAAPSGASSLPADDGKARYVFGRVLANRFAGSRLYVHVDPTEQEARIFALNSVIPIQFSSLEADRLDMLEPLVHLPNHDMLNSLQRFCKQEFNNFLVSVGVPYDVLQQAQQGVFSLRRRGEVVDIRAQLEKLQQKLPLFLVQPVEARVHAHLQQYLEALQRQPPYRHTFHPTRAKQLQALHSIDCQALIREQIAEHIATCDFVLEELRQLQDDMLFGKRKNALADWWLSTITDHIDIFLSNTGYNMNAIPSNYIDEAPSSIRAVRENFDVIRKIIKSLNSGDDIWKIKRMIDNLKSCIYPRITAFIYDAKLILIDALKFEIPANLDESEEYLNKLTATDFHEAHALKQNELAPEQNERIGWLIKDLEYLDEMAKMEEPEYKSTNFHIVPVSGLVLSQLLRYQNECKTVLELWDRSESSELASRPALSLAVLVLDWDEVNRLTKGAVDANAQDANGWTPLHFACATSVADSNRLRMCHKLLTVGTDPAITNLAKNTALHSFVRLKVAPAEQVDYTEVFQLMLEKSSIGKEIVHAKNNTGQTPLHLAVITQNLLGMSLLLESQADPNLQTDAGDSSLHLAVRISNIGILKALLEHKADAKLQNAKHQTPQMLALALNAPHYMVQALAAHDGEELDPDAFSPRGALDVSQGATEQPSERKRKRASIFGLALSEMKKERRKGRKSSSRRSSDEPPLDFTAMIEANPDMQPVSGSPLLKTGKRTRSGERKKRSGKRTSGPNDETEDPIHHGHMTPVPVPVPLSISVDDGDAAPPASNEDSDAAGAADEVIDHAPDPAPAIEDEHLSSVAATSVDDGGDDGALDELAQSGDYVEDEPEQSYAEYDNAEYDNAEYDNAEYEQGEEGEGGELQYDDNEPVQEDEYELAAQAPLPAPLPPIAPLPAPLPPALLSPIHANAGMLLPLAPLPAPLPMRAAGLASPHTSPALISALARPPSAPPVAPLPPPLPTIHLVPPPTAQPDDAE